MEKWFGFRSLPLGKYLMNREQNRCGITKTMLIIEALFKLSAEISK